MRVLFFGTSDFAVPVLDALVASQHEVLAVVTQPDKPQGRKRIPASSPVKLSAIAHGLPLLQPRRVRSAEFMTTARELAPDALVLAAFGQIIPQALLDLPPYGPINVHGSLLPAYRGAAPIQYAIMNGETVTGITTMWMDATLDTGDILLKQACAIEPDDTTGTLTVKLAQMGAQLALETLELLAQAKCPRQPQDNALATYSPAINPADTHLSWNDTAVQLHNRVRALSPRPTAFARINGRTLKIWRTRVDDSQSGAPGVVSAVTKEGVYVGTACGTLVLTDVQAEGAKRMDAAAWSRGARITPGARFEPVI